MSKLRLAKSALTDKVYVGELDEEEIFFKENKQDVTNDFLEAVIARWSGYEETIVVGEKEYTVKVEEKFNLLKNNFISSANK